MTTGTDDDATTTTTTTDDVGDGGGVDDDRAGTDIAEQIRGAFSDGATALKDALVGILPGHDAAGADDVTDDATTTTPARAQSSAQTEAGVAAQVRAELDRIGAEEKNEERLRALEERTAETAPAKVRRLTRAIWGG